MEFWLEEESGLYLYTFLFWGVTRCTFVERVLRILYFAR